DTFQMNAFVNKMRQNDRNELVIDYLKVQVMDQKPYSEWKLDEVLLNIYHRKTGYPEFEFEKFNLDNLPPLSPQLSNEELNEIVGQLKDRKLVFQDVNNYETTAHEFISVFLVNAVKF